MAESVTQQGYALAIHALGSGQVAPVVYDLIGSPTEIGSAYGNHIVLDGPDVEPYHLSVHRLGSRWHVLVDQSVAQRRGESTWLERRRGDTLYCPRHGELPPPQGSNRCPFCSDSSRTLWLLRPLEVGDVFPVGESFAVSVLPQGRPDLETDSPFSPWPDSFWLESPAFVAAPPTDEEAVVTDRDYPFHDSNLWCWDPPESPFPVFMHQRANSHTTRHARGSRDREVGGVLLGHVYRDPEDDVLYPVISHAISGRFAAEAPGHVTFTCETWLDIDRQREERYSGRQIVGWYHTHPGLDIFLSEWDLFVHRHFFRQPWHVALVIDPHQDTAGFFVWSQGQVLDPLRPHQVFTLADTEDGAKGESLPRVRIKLGQRVT